MSKKLNLPPDPEKMNDDRAKWALVAVSAFADETGLSIFADGLDTAICDLLGDLAHLCDRNELNLAMLWERAAMHYQMDIIPTN